VVIGPSAPTSSSLTVEADRWRTTVPTAMHNAAPRAHKTTRSESLTQKTYRANMIGAGDAE
jgi:hypothetical protein